MPIYERLTSNGQPGSPDKIPVHAFSSMFMLRLGNAGGLATQIQNRMIEVFELTAEDQAELAAIIATHNAITNANANIQRLLRAEYANWIHHTFLTAEAGHASKAECKLILGF